MSSSSCSVSNHSPRWGFLNLFHWKLLPERFGGGRAYIQRFKDAWVSHNKTTINLAALRNKLPPPLLAGVCWIEVGGDPGFIDRLAFEVRRFDWSGPGWIDRFLTITKEPLKTSFGSVSMQLLTAAETLGLDPSTMTSSQFSDLATCLEKDVFNIQTVARHLRKLVEHDGFELDLPKLTPDEVRIVAARYNRGTGLPLNKIVENTSYGDFIVKFWPRFVDLLKR